MTASSATFRSRGRSIRGAQGDFAQKPNAQSLYSVRPRLHELNLRGADPETWRSI